MAPDLPVRGELVEGAESVTLTAWNQGVFHFLHFVTLAASIPQRCGGDEGDKAASGEGDIEGDKACERLGRQSLAGAARAAAAKAGASESNSWRAAGWRDASTGRGL